MLSLNERNLAEMMSTAIERGDKAWVIRLKTQLDEKQNRTVFENLLIAKATRFLGLDIERELAEYEVYIGQLGHRVLQAERPIVEINQLKARHGAKFDEARAQRVLACIELISELAKDETDEQTWHYFRMQVMNFLAVLTEEYERVAPDVNPLVELRNFRELVLENMLPVGPWQATILAKYAMASPLSEHEIQRLKAWLNRQRLSEMIPRHQTVEE